MNQSQINRKDMVDATLAFLDENVQVWQSIAKIGEVKNNLSELNQAIGDAADEQDKSQVAVGKIKVALKRTMAEKADILNDVIEVYALMNGDDTLVQKMADSASDLLKMKNSDMLRRVKVIIDSAIEKQEVLVSDYGVTEEQVLDLEADYDRFLELNGQPRQYQVKSAMATQTLGELFAEVNQLLTNRLDNLMKVFKRRNPSFYNGYLKARMVVDY